MQRALAEAAVGFFFFLLLKGTLQHPGAFSHPVSYSDSQVMEQRTGETMCERKDIPLLEPEWTSGLLIPGGCVGNVGYANVYSRNEQLGSGQFRCTAQKVFI